MMGWFAEMVLRDRGFLLGAEFGEMHEIDGKPVECVVDDQTNRDRKGGTEFGVAMSTFLFYARSEDLPPRREAGEELRFDGIPYTVETWDEDMGVSTVALFINVNA